jgi:hypothetical protein
VFPRSEKIFWRCRYPSSRRSRAARGRWSTQQSSGEFASAVPTARARHAAVSKHEDAAKNSAQFMLRSTTNSIMSVISSLAEFTNKDEPARWPSGAPSRRPPLGQGVLRHTHRTSRYSDVAQPGQAGQYKATRREHGGYEAFHDLLVWLEGHADWLMGPNLRQTHSRAKLTRVARLILLDVGIATASLPMRAIKPWFGGGWRRAFRRVPEGQARRPARDRCRTVRYARPRARFVSPKWNYLLTTLNASSLLFMRCFIRCGRCKNREDMPSEFVP